MTGPLTGSLAGLLVALGASLLYLASRHQQVTLRPLPSRILAIGAGAAMTVSLALLLAVAGAAAAVFILVTLAMLVWSVVPLAIAWLRRPNAGRQ